MSRVKLTNDSFIVIIDTNKGVFHGEERPIFVLIYTEIGKVTMS